jgi:hypothetical protein
MRTAAWLAVATMCAVATVTGCGRADGTVGHSDGPVITPARHWEDAPTAGLDGKLTERHGCLVFNDDVAFWPHGSSWDASAHAVDMPGGARAAVGQRFVGGGGEYDTDTDFGALLGSEDAARRLGDCLDRTDATGVVYVATTS